jgi:hypothetical protein
VVLRLEGLPGLYLLGGRGSAAVRIGEACRMASFVVLSGVVDVLLVDGVVVGCCLMSEILCRVGEIHLRNVVL